MELVSIPFPTLFVRISLLCHHFNALLRLLLPSSWYLSKPTPLSSTIISTEKEASSATSPAELTRAFQMFDRDGDGRISKQELCDSLENLGIYIADADLEAVIEWVDVDGDGCVDAEEFAALYQAVMEREAEEAEMREAFEVFDQNGDGFIAAEELQTVLDSLGVAQGGRTAEEECKRMISKVDVDGDGRVSFGEFKQMMKRGGIAVAVNSQ
ncbi:calmodulin-like protein 3 [Zingiber officinale]|uniref:EF-hand domain-containing protein n=1 Tax=Zingiber officinale TaxID=94328 RepID=A0A8J5M6M8_ZINOF|nr:calmodulin-like protein 3 [Zingiber officinale]KAG6535485.1 hypothetical protein ZIOFF_000485 [Zingiber officinale]